MLSSMVSIVNGTVLENCLHIYSNACPSLQFILHKPSTLDTISIVCIIQMHLSNICSHHCRLDQLRKLYNLFIFYNFVYVTATFQRIYSFIIPYNFCESGSLYMLNIGVCSVCGHFQSHRSINWFIQHLQGQRIASYHSFLDITTLCLMCILVYIIATSWTDQTI
jgi:hypothetical protein